MTPTIAKIKDIGDAQFVIKGYPAKARTHSANRNHNDNIHNSKHPDSPGVLV